MKRLFQSKGIAATILLLIIIALIYTFAHRFSLGWWTFCDIFFAFMCAFSHLMSLCLSPINERVGSKLESVALVLFVLFVIALVVELIICPTLYF
ncbi:MAG: hypothetical protein K2M03_02895 [Muribaculaceae bacterium]|nr:hypothetical protein [Muribaculaceae bacterium]MDE6294991.1 hypothetical protein [Muribaculaceae bacterium]